ncbi:MAG: sigma-70 family RNA polymerase sigma factor [Phycisphaerae bacterium]|nr:sigma-70 family RNA polymerase sigma factor [Phycisphaerae bacterium]
MPAPEKKRRAATEELVPLVYQELRQVARRYFRNQRPGFTLRPTEVVDEACLHLIQHSRIEWESSEHFRAIATRKIWQVIVDHLKKRYARKRGGVPLASATASEEPAEESGAADDTPWQRVPLEGISVEWRDRTVDVLDLADALDALAAESARLKDVVMLHWFGGLKYSEVARCLGVSASTVEKDFRYALAWLNRRLTGNSEDVR